MGPYEEILVGLKLNDKSYKIYALAGAAKYENNISDCYDEIEGIEKEFKNLFPNAEISKENNVKHPYDKSGSYGIQDWSCLFVKEIKGCFYNVIGFPISKFYKVINENNIKLTFHE